MVTDSALAVLFFCFPIFFHRISQVRCAFYYSLRLSCIKVILLLLQDGGGYSWAGLGLVTWEGFFIRRNLLCVLSW
jgi:hypothetical protein